jgi:hypothetical protein
MIIPQPLRIFNDLKKFIFQPRKSRAEESSIDSTTTTRNTNRFSKEIPSLGLGLFSVVHWALPRQYGNGCWASLWMLPRGRGGGLKESQSS